MSLSKMIVWALFIIGHMGLFVYTQKGSIISMVVLPTTEIIEPKLRRNEAGAWAPVFFWMQFALWCVGSEEKVLLCNHFLFILFENQNQTLLTWFDDCQAPVELDSLFPWNIKGTEFDLHQSETNCVRLFSTSKGSPNLWRKSDFDFHWVLLRKLTFSSSTNAFGFLSCVKINYRLLIFL